MARLKESGAESPARGDSSGGSEKLAAHGICIDLPPESGDVVRHARRAGLQLLDAEAAALMLGGTTTRVAGARAGLRRALCAEESDNIYKQDGRGAEDAPP